MNLYDVFMAPLERRFLKVMRSKLIPKAYGDILEIGAGTGANFDFYDSAKIKSLSVLDNEKNEYAKKRAPINSKFIEASGTKIPFKNESFDCVVETLVLCSVEENELMVSEIARVLKSGGIFIHIDHGLPKPNHLRNLFKFIAPLWHGMTGSCRIDKDHKSVIESSGLNTIEEGYKGKGVFYWGVSKK